MQTPLIKLSCIHWSAKHRCVSVELVWGQGPALTCDWLVVLVGICGLRAGVGQGDGCVTITWRPESTAPPTG